MYETEAVSSHKRGDEVVEGKKSIAPKKLRKSPVVEGTRENRKIRLLEEQKVKANADHQEHVNPNSGKHEFTHFAHGWEWLERPRDNRIARLLCNKAGRIKPRKIRKPVMSNCIYYSLVEELLGGAGVSVDGAGDPLDDGCGLSFCTNGFLTLGLLL